MQAEGGCTRGGCARGGCTPHREDAQDHGTFISLTGTLYVIVNSRKDKETCTALLHMLKYVPDVQKIYDRSNE